MFKKIAIISCVLFLGACSSAVHMGEGSNGYSYAGEKYGAVTVELSEAVTEDSSKMVRVDQLDLEQKVQSHLASKGLYEEGATNTVSILVNKIHIRNAFNAIMFGFMSGSDSLDGTVELQIGKTVNPSFDISASYSLGGVAGGQNDARLGWLSDKFAELTASTIAGEE